METDAIIYVKIISFNDDIKRACVGDNFSWWENPFKKIH